MSTYIEPLRIIRHLDNLGCTQAERAWIEAAICFCSGLSVESLENNQLMPLSDTQLADKRLSENFAADIDTMVTRKAVINLAEAIVNCEGLHHTIESFDDHTWLHNFGIVIMRSKSVSRYRCAGNPDGAASVTLTEDTEIEQLAATQEPVCQAQLERDRADRDARHA